MENILYKILIRVEYLCNFREIIDRVKLKIILEQSILFIKGTLFIISFSGIT